MAIDPPYRLDPFQNVVNVHWQPMETWSDWEVPIHRMFPLASYPGYYFVSYVYPVTISPATEYEGKDFYWINNDGGHWYLISWNPEAWGWYPNYTLDDFISNGGESFDLIYWFIGPTPPEPRPPPYDA